MDSFEGMSITFRNIADSIDDEQEKSNLAELQRALERLAGEPLSVQVYNDRRQIEPV